MSFHEQTLFLDIASHEKLIALVTDGVVSSSVSVDDHTQESALMGMIETLLAKAGASLQSLTKIGAVTGPGGFMSVRVGVSIANALAWSLQIPLAGVHLSDIWASRARTPPLARFASGDSNLEPQTFVWLHSTKRNLLFVRGFGALKKIWPEPVIVSLDDARNQLSADTSFVGELIDEHRLALPQVKAFESLEIIKDILPTLLPTLNYEAKPLEPWYGRGA